MREDQAGETMGAVEAAPDYRKRLKAHLRDILRRARLLMELKPFTLWLDTGERGGVAAVLRVDDGVVHARWQDNGVEFQMSLAQWQRQFVAKPTRDVYKRQDKPPKPARKGPFRRRVDARRAAKDAGMGEEGHGFHVEKDGLQWYWHAGPSCDPKG